MSDELTNGNEEISTQLEGIMTGSILDFAVQHIIDCLGSPLTEESVASIHILMQFVKDRFDPIRSLLESESFWRESILQDQEYVTVLGL